MTPNLERDIEKLFDVVDKVKDDVTSIKIEVREMAARLESKVVMVMQSDLPHLISDELKEHTERCMAAMSLRDKTATRTETGTSDTDTDFGGPMLNFFGHAKFWNIVGVFVGAALFLCLLVGTLKLEQLTSVIMRLGGVNNQAQQVSPN